MGNKHSYYKRYVDEVITVMSVRLEYLNIKHVNIKFIMEIEIEKDKKLAFLDVVRSF